MTDYLATWNALATTDKNYTKDFKRSGGFSGTDINPMWRIRRMTEQFGPIGVGWGYEVKRTWREDFGSTPYVFAEIQMWYYQNEAEENPAYTGVQIGGTDASRTADEAYKMAITDGLGKCMAQLGLGADVYLGEFDSKYSRDNGSRPQNTKSPPTNGSNGKAATYKPKSWGEVKIHFGKKAGTFLADMEPGDLQWWWENWAGKHKESDCKGDDLLLWRGLRAAVNDSSQEQQREEEPATVPEDCPF